MTVYVLQVPGLGDGGWQWLALVGALFVPFSEAAVALVNRAVTGGVGAAILPGLELADGIPEELRTLVVVPTLLGGEAELLEQIEQLEVHYLTGTRGDLSFALLADGIDARQSVLERDVRLLKLGAAAIERLNRRHAPAPGGPRFLLLYRQRRFNPQERRWIGWERKRGKLHELNRLLRGATDTSFASLGESGPTVPSGVRFVITLDADTRLPRETLRRLIGKMAHPLNQPLFEAATQRVVSGYAILQPRVTPALPLGREGSLYQRVFSGPGGMDPYAAAVSDVYQDLFGEGSYTGKGIYDVDAFEAAMPAASVKTAFSVMICSRAYSPVQDWLPMWRWLRKRRRASMLSLNACIAGRAVTGNCCHGSSVIGAVNGQCRGSAAARCSTTCAVRCLRLPPRSRCCFPGCCRCLRRCSAACYWLGAWHSRPVCRCA